MLCWLVTAAHVDCLFTDINECTSTSHGCGHQCMNVEGSYTCACRDGNALGSDNRTCSVSCGGRLTGTSGSFQTPDWPEHYPQLNFRCVWTIENLTAQQSARLEVDDSAYGINGRPPCSGDYIEFFNPLTTISVPFGYKLKRLHSLPQTSNCGDLILLDSAKVKWQVVSAVAS